MHNLHPQEKPQKKIYWWIKKTNTELLNKRLQATRRTSLTLQSLSQALTEPLVFSLNNQFYTPDTETQIAQNLDTCVTVFNKLDSFLHKLAHVLHLSFSKTTEGWVVSSLNLNVSCCTWQVTETIWSKWSRFGALSFRFIALKPT